MRVLMTIVAVVTQAFGVYCEESLSPAFSHIWVRSGFLLSGYIFDHRANSAWLDCRH